MPAATVVESLESAAASGQDASEQDDDDDEEEEEEVHEFNGIRYASWKERVDAKRAFRAQQMNRLLEAPLAALRASTKAATKTTTNVRRRRRVVASNTNEAQQRPPPRRSKRVRNEAAEAIEIDNTEHAGAVVTIRGRDAARVTPDKQLAQPQPAFYYRHRVNDGSPVSLTQATVDLVPEKWRTTTFALSASVAAAWEPGASAADDDCHNFVESAATATLVAKVVPDRIYGMTVHPSREHLLVAAGDKQGYVGLWKVNDDTVKDDNDDDTTNTTKTTTTNNDTTTPNVHRFKYHSGAAASLQWTRNGQSLFSTSYDGTCRMLDMATGTARCIFAASDEDKDESRQTIPGYGLDEGHSYWTQFGCLDHRQEDCCFITTSTGRLYHVDSRVNGRAGSVTLNHKLSDKKLNSVSLHPNGHALVTAGLDGRVCLWDVRTLAARRTKSSATTAAQLPIASYHGTKSINAAFFSPSGRTVVATTMHHRLDLLRDFHSATGTVHQAVPSIRHDNLTGRWLATFHAVWHPTLDVFGVGSMARPRVVDIYTPATHKSSASNKNSNDDDHPSAPVAFGHQALGGELLTAVASRLAFHPRTDRLVLAGGNSSGRVTIVR
jgi:hypothetical protein